MKTPSSLNVSEAAWPFRMNSVRCLVPATVTTGDAGIGALRYKPSDGLGFMQCDLAGGEQVVAFSKPDGATVVYLVNQGPETKAQISVKTASGVKSVEAALPAKTLCAVLVK